MNSRFPSCVKIVFFFLAAFFLPAESASEEELANISLRLYNGRTVDEEIYDEPLVNAVEFLKLMDSEKPTVLYVHGFNEDLDRESVRTVVGAYLKRQDHNVLAVDWDLIAGKSYVAVASSAPGVGKAVAKALNEMVAHSLDYRRLHVVGHSLGGQISGYIGRNVNFTLPRITGLDPAGPGFNILIDHLSSTDADFVDIIHTDGGVYGLAKRSGTADFYPNHGTRIQPGCPRWFFPMDNNDFCSHHRSWRFYAESVTNETAFISVKCGSWQSFKLGRCKNNKKEVPMGFATPVDTKGSFYLGTNSKSPYGLGEAGV